MIIQPMEVSAMEISTQAVFRETFREYPDVLDVRQTSKLLSVSTKTVYRLLREGTIESLKIGREFRIPKVNVMRYAKIFKASLSEPPTA